MEITNGDVSKLDASIGLEGLTDILGSNERIPDNAPINPKQVKNSFQLFITVLLWLDKSLFIGTFLGLGDWVFALCCPCFFDGLAIFTPYSSYSWFV